MHNINVLFLKLLITSLLLSSDAIINANDWKLLDQFSSSKKFENHICLSENNRNQIKSKISKNIKKLNLDSKLKRNSITVDFSWPLKLSDNYNDYGYHGVSGFIDHNMNYSGNLLDYNCGERTYDTDSYNHRGVDYFLWPFTWNKVNNDAVSVVAATNGIIILKSDGNYDQNCGGWNTNSSSEWNAVFVRNFDGSQSWYGHMKNGSITEKDIGDTVYTGEHLGIVASSGISTGPHLHFENYDSNGQLIDPYSGSCNAMNENSWWENQLPYYDSAINKVMTHSSPPEFFWNECAKEANIYASNNFFPGQDIYIAAYYRDILANQVSKWKLIDPENNIYHYWEHNIGSTIDHSAAEYIYYHFEIPEITLTGKWKVVIDYNYKEYVHEFSVCKEGDLVDECGVCGGIGILEGSCDCFGNVVDICGVCGGDGIPEGACDCLGNVEDCAGECGGILIEDECGDCGGDGSACRISFNLKDLNPNSSTYNTIINPDNYLGKVVLYYFPLSET